MVTGSVLTMPVSVGKGQQHTVRSKLLSVAKKRISNFHFQAQSEKYAFT
jgi:hypothetical protein